MNKELTELIHEFNSNLIKEDNSKRIIFANLESEIKKLEWGMTIASNSTK